MDGEHPQQAYYEDPSSSHNHHHSVFAIVAAIVLIVGGVSAYFILKGGGGGGGPPDGGEGGGPPDGGGGGGPPFDCVLSSADAPCGECSQPCGTGGTCTIKKKVLAPARNGGECVNPGRDVPCNQKTCTAETTCSVDSHGADYVETCGKAGMGAACCVTEQDLGSCPKNYDVKGKFPGTNKLYCSPGPKACTNLLPSPICPNGWPKGSALSNPDAPYWNLNKHTLTWGGGESQYCKAAFGDGSYALNGAWHDCGKNGGQDYTASASSCCTQFTPAQAQSRMEYLEGLNSNAQNVNGVFVDG